LQNDCSDQPATARIVGVLHFNLDLL
jgi:hypothetical protein